MLSVITVATDSFELLKYFGVLRWVWGFLFTLTFSLRLLVVWVRLLLSVIILYTFKGYGAKGLVDTRIVKIRIPKDVDQTSKRIACLLVA